jgi:hypothetical protein
MGSNMEIDLGIRTWRFKMKGNSCFFCGEYANLETDLCFRELPMAIHTVPACRECERKYRSKYFCRYDQRNKLLVFD